MATAPDYIVTYSHATGTGRVTKTRVFPAESAEAARTIAAKTLSRIPGFRIESARRHRWARK
jgi:hypothetical protein